MKSEFSLTYLIRAIAVIALVLSFVNGTGLMLAALFAVFGLPVLVLTFAAHMAIDWLQNRREC